MKSFMSILVIGILSLSIVLSCQQESDSTDTTDADKTQNTSVAETVTLVQAMDDYHRVLRPLMHQALPDQNVAAFKENSEALLQQAEKIDQAVIPEKFADQRDKIEPLCKSILEKTRRFHESTGVGSDEQIFDAFLAAHDEYEVLADIVYKL